MTKKIAIGIVLLFVVSMIAGGIDSCRDFEAKNGWKKTRDTMMVSDIYSLHLNQAMQGSFVLGIGSFGEQESFVFYRKTKSGGFIRMYVPTDDAILFEGYEQPKVAIPGRYNCYYQNGKITKWVFNEGFTLNRHKTQLYIPTGTITERVDNIDIR